MKILLINPPRYHELVGKNPSLIEEHRGFNPPLGLLYLASAIKRFSNHQVDVLDAQARRLSYHQLRDYLLGKAVDVVGISAMTFTLIDVYKTVRLVKEILPGAKIVIGGVHVHLYPQETIDWQGVDFAFCGEAEFPFVKFLEVLDSNGQWEDVPGLVYKNNNGDMVKNAFDVVNDLDRLPFPRRDIVRIDDYGSLLSRGKLSTTIVSSRGCPFQCAFCDRPLSPITSRFRVRGAGSVVDELSECVALGIKDFLFYDDTFTVNRQRVMDICEQIICRKLKIRWDIRTRVDTVDEQMLRMLKQAGCCAIHYGVEAGNDKILKAIKKGFSITKVKETFRLTQKVGIDTLAYFMIGLPRQKRSDIQDTYDLVRDLRPDYVHFTVFSPYPGTELYRLGLERGIIKRDLWREFAANPDEDFQLPLWEENFSRQHLNAMLVKFYKAFYLRPSYVLSRLMRVRSYQELLKKTKAGLGVLLMSKDKVDRIRE